MLKFRERGDIVDAREKEIIALTYLLSIIPLFGILIAAIIIWAWKEKSETVVFHGKQAIAGHAVFLVMFVFICLFSLFAVLVGVLDSDLKRVLMTFDRFILYVSFIALVVWNFYFAWMSIEGRDVEFPIIGGLLRGETE